MAIIQNPIIGRARKSAGGMTFSKMYDKNVMRSKPFSVADAKSPAQLTQRAFITLLTALCKMFTPDNLILLFPNKPATRSRYSELQSQLSAAAVEVDGVKNIDFSTLQNIGNGDMITVSDVTVDAGAVNLSISWTDFSGSDIDATDPVTGVVFNTTVNEAVVLKDCATVADEMFDTPLPSGWSEGDTVFLYLGVRKVVKFKAGAELTRAVK